jgi:hypothetical protein
MALRKTEKKHLGKKRKSLSKRKAHSKKKRHSKKRTTKKRSHKGGDTLTTEVIYIYNLKTYIINKCPDKALKDRLLKCINGEKIDGYFDDNNSTEDVVEFIKDLREKIKEDAPNEKLKNELIGCVNIATHESPLTTI